MKKSGMIKEPGCSWIEVQNRYTFVVGDTSHSQKENTYAKVEVLSRQMKEARYKLDTNLVLHDVEAEQ